MKKTRNSLFITLCLLTCLLLLVMGCSSSKTSTVSTSPERIALENTTQKQLVSTHENRALKNQYLDEDYNVYSIVKEGTDNIVDHGTYYSFGHERRTLSSVVQNLDGALDYLGKRFSIILDETVNIKTQTVPLLYAYSLDKEASDEYTAFEFAYTDADTQTVYIMTGKLFNYDGYYVYTADMFFNTYTRLPEDVPLTCTVIRQASDYFVAEDETVCQSLVYGLPDSASNESIKSLTIIYSNTKESEQVVVTQIDKSFTVKLTDRPNYTKQAFEIEYENGDVKKGCLLFSLSDKFLQSNYVSVNDPSLTVTKYAPKSN